MEWELVYTDPSGVYTIFQATDRERSGFVRRLSRFQARRHGAVGEAFDTRPAAKDWIEKQLAMEATKPRPPGPRW